MRNWFPICPAHASIQSRKMKRRREKNASSQSALTEYQDYGSNSFSFLPLNISITLPLRRLWSNNRKEKSIICQNLKSIGATGPMILRDKYTSTTNSNYWEVLKISIWTESNEEVHNSAPLIPSIPSFAFLHFQTRP